MSDDRIWLLDFIRESNMIEGIIRRPSKTEIEAHEKILALEHVQLNHLVEFVSVVAPHARLRDKRGLNVRVGSHIAPLGGPDIPKELTELLANRRFASPFEVHRHYEWLHPFTDGNGRSGRALWLWQMHSNDEDETMRARELGFLRMWYYQSLEANIMATR